MRIRSRNRNSTRVAYLGHDRFLDGRRRGRNCGPNLGLQFTDGALQFCVLFGVLFDEFGQLLLEFGIPKIEPNRQERCGEQQQPIETE
jgi:hypothetical protein